MRTGPTPFDNLPTHKNNDELSKAFIQKWAMPYYLKIGSYDRSSWPEAVKQLKHEITLDVCLLLLGDFNWRTRLAGAYFAAVKGYKELIDVIGIHLLKSEVCCVGHVYTLVLTFFNDEQSIRYLHQHAACYLTQYHHHADPKLVIEALLYLDNKNGTAHFSEHANNWYTYQQERTAFEKWQAEEVAKMLGQASPPTSGNKRANELSTTYFEEQLPVLLELNQFIPGT